jgi:type VI secretion system protein ImpG
VRTPVRRTGCFRSKSASKAYATIVEPPREDTTMEKLLPYFERELGMLRRASHEFAARYPKLAGSLSMTGESCADPHVERLIQAIAYLNARTAKHLDDGYAGFTEALLGVLYPHYLRPIPSCSVARIDSGGVRDTGAVFTVPRGTEMKSLGSTAAGCKFSTAYDVTVAPLRISAARFDSFVQVPSSMRLPPDVTASIRITIDSTGAGGTGHEYTLSLIDRDFDPLSGDTGTASIDLTCTNRNLPPQLPCGLPDVTLPDQ